MIGKGEKKKKEINIGKFCLLWVKGEISDMIMTVIIIIIIATNYYHDSCTE